VSVFKVMEIIETWVYRVWLKNCNE
jgi:hypothetical protein